MTDADQNSDARAATETSPPPLRLQEPLDPRTFAGCRAEELFAFHDRAFVESAYAAALGRAPDAGELRATLADLRGGRRDKREIVADLCASEEGARVGAGARVVGVGAPGFGRRLRRAPLVGYVWRLLASLARLPTALRHQREFELYTLAQQQQIADFVNDGRRRHDEQLRLLGLRLDEEIARAHADLRGAVADAHEAVSMLSDAVATLDARQAEERAHLEALIAEQRHALEGHQRALEAQRRRLDAQEEFSVQEQHAIVEAQKAVLAEIESRLTESHEARRRALEESGARVANEA
ncbi:MAG: hypothetical protein LC746_01685 [Acidobacteria bacterium]|nr:hypothetical protein [Acidobacteriota bacterium]